MTDRVGQRFGDYRLTRFLGEGTFGDVYFGEQVYEKSSAAVKVFKARLTPDKFKDFINEVRTVLLRHPNIVQILDFGIGEDDIPFLVMEYAPNGTLLQRHPRGTRLPLPTVITYVKQIAAALQYAHDQRRIHRDVKPENILFGRSNELLLSDFGIAAVAHSTYSQRTEEAIGTAVYMAPEQWQGKPVPATDQYALGIIVYEWLCGECPFGGSTLQLMYQHLQAPPPPLQSKVPTIWPEAEQAVMKALAKDPSQRFANVQAFADALELQGIAVHKPKEQWLNEGEAHLNAHQYEDALGAFERALHLDPNNAIAHFNKGNALQDLKRYQEAITAFERAIRLDPKLTIAYNNKGNALKNLKRYQEAIIAYEQVLRLDPTFALAHFSKGNALYNLKRYEEANPTNCATRLLKS